MQGAGAEDSGMPEHLQESDSVRYREAGNSGHDASVIACPKKTGHVPDSHSKTVAVVLQPVSVST